MAQQIPVQLDTTRVVSQSWLREFRFSIFQYFPVFSLGHHSSCFMLFGSKKSNCSSFFLKTFSFQRSSLWKNIFPPSLWFIAPDGGVHPGTEKYQELTVVSIDLNIVPKTFGEKFHNFGTRFFWIGYSPPISWLQHSMQGDAGKWSSHGRIPTLCQTWFWIILFVGWNIKDMFETTGYQAIN